jgi:hypothetical protein
VWGTAQIDQRRVPIQAGRIVGDEMSFNLSYPKIASFTCRYDGHFLRGTCRSFGEESIAWAGVRPV